MPKTIRARLIAGLDALGYARPAKRPANKYEMYVDPAGGYLYIGRAGALRRGPNTANSIPVSESFRDRVLAAGDAAIAGQRRKIP